MRSPSTSLRRMHRLAALCLGMSACTTCLASVSTIHEGGPTVPIGQYLTGFFSEEAVSSGAAAPAAPTGRTALPVTFPVTTTSMQPGHLPAPMRLRASGWLVTPMFIVGDDPQSRQWLATRRARLRQSGAAGLVVNVASIEAFRALRALAPDVPMAPGSVEDFARQAGLSIYPLFVSVDGRVSQRIPQ